MNDHAHHHDHQHTGHQHHHAGSDHEHHAAPVEKPYTDPVCGMNVAGDPQKKITHAGTDHYFCSTKCMEKFRANPHAYLHKDAQQPQENAPAGTIYTCPMHPEVRQPTPGNCPKCGMTLESVLPSLEEEDNPELKDFRRRFWWTLPLTGYSGST